MPNTLLKTYEWDCTNSLLLQQNKKNVQIGIKIECVVYKYCIKLNNITEEPSNLIGQYFMTTFKHFMTTLNQKHFLCLFWKLLPVIKPIYFVILLYVWLLVYFICNYNFFSQLSKVQCNNFFAEKSSQAHFSYESGMKEILLFATIWNMCVCVCMCVCIFGVAKLKARSSAPFKDLV